MAELKEFIKIVGKGRKGARDLIKREAEDAMTLLMAGDPSEGQKGAFLMALRLKGESIEEISAFGKVLREHGQRISPKVEGTLIDACGSYDGKLRTLNISTIASFVIAGAGVPVVRHGGRGYPLKMGVGTADVLEALGVRIALRPEEVERIIEKIGIGFLYTPIIHEALDGYLRLSDQIGVRTVFHTLASILNPADAGVQIVGVAHGRYTEKMAQVLRNLGTERAMVVQGLEGVDEISTVNQTRITELRGSKIETYEIEASNFGLGKAELEELAGGDAEYNAKVALNILKNKEKGARRDIVILNAAAGIYMGGKAKSIEEAIPLAEGSIDSGDAYEKLMVLVDVSQEF